MNPLVIADIVGIFAFAISGFLMAAQHMLISTALTAMGDGMIRDLMINQVPAVSALLFLNYAGWMNEMTILLVPLACIKLRLLAYTRQWHLPRITV